MNMTDAERVLLGDRVAAERRRRFATKSSAYKAADVNPATWTRIESGQVVREDRLIAAVKTLWPHSGGDWRRIGPEVNQYDGPPAAQPMSPSESRAEVIRRSVQGDPAEHPEFDEWMAAVDLRLQVLERISGAVRRDPLDEQSMIKLRNSISHWSFSPEVEASALRVFVDYASDPSREPIEADGRARLLYAYAASGQAPAYLVDELMRRFGDLDPDVDPSAPRVDLAHPIEGEVAVDLSAPDPERTSGGKQLRQGRNR